MFIYIIFSLLIFTMSILATAYFYSNKSINNLKHNNNLITNLLLSLGDGFYLWDEEKRIEKFSPNLQLLLNTIFYSFNELADFFEESHQLKKNFADARKINKSFTIDLKGKDTEIYCFCYGQSIVNNQDKIVGVLLWIQNTTKEKLLITQLENKNIKLKQELTNYKDMIDILPYPTWKRDKDFKITICNPSYIKLTQCNTNREIFKNRTLSNQVASDKYQENAYTIIDNERKLYTLTETINPNTQEFIGYGQDITQIKQLTQEIQYYIELQKNLLSNLSCAVVVYNNDSKLLFYNNNFAKFWHLEQPWLDKRPTYTEVLHKIYTSNQFFNKETFNFLQQQHTFFRRLLDPYHATITLTNNFIIKISVIPTHKQELIFIYDHIK
ncbi:hypothetical protein HL033_00980 [Neoehrlichia mikurensis]|uniref:PAS domain-containing protein n=1 Tax=Neoehrlichia mikurensis TaxID=89586 RepID=A0A9Q9F3F5_9RICK|nr:hypothetical protein [Neoehrlichia mikurensis]QXK92139.1 hypothetical protein IAH97_00975 [Neoehrlichia mikurensis]QXK92596.1 hypothetical protein HUN61_00980 [Neoehrlichia mikurensis]QXK93833.1 hypothetical protein HL033_00980 [Neoehrlichia mikurensis]UTO55172.1 hypothetical protein LUA82_03150 [Neoehrlichia mikurensis]UTO56092.1 hypothetical protein LUA81_03125 [Neoehrlichia mikurensis]